MSRNFDVVLNELEEETLKLDNKYEDIQRMLAKEGPYDQTFTTLIYAESETRVLLYFLWVIRRSITNENTEIGTLRMVTKELLKQMTEFVFNERRMGFKNIPKVLKGAEKAVNGNVSREDLYSLIQVLIQFMGKLNFRIDSEIPWNKLIETYKEIKNSL